MFSDNSQVRDSQKKDPNHTHYAGLWTSEWEPYTFNYHHLLSYVASVVVLSSYMPLPVPESRKITPVDKNIYGKNEYERNI